MENIPRLKPVLLHIEDDDVAAYLFRVALRENGVEVDVFRLCDGQDALLFLTRTGIFSGAPRPDAVVLDLHMPKKGGHDVLAELRAETSLQDLPVIMFTSSIRREDKEKALALGANGYVQKTADLDSFANAAKQVLRYISTGRNAPDPAAID
jgi:two-component system response regulator